MAPVHSRQLLAWSLPTLAVLLSYFWFKRKRLGQQSDIRDTNSNQVVKVAECRAGAGGQNNNQSTKEKNQHPEQVAVSINGCRRVMPQQAMGGVAKSAEASPRKPFSRSLSGVDTAPIDIIIPHEMRASKSAAHQPVISDEDLDLHIQKVNSMRPSMQRSFSRQSPQKSSTEETSPRVDQQQKPASTTPEEGITMVAPRVGSATPLQAAAKMDDADVNREPPAVNGLDSAEGNTACAEESNKSPQKDQEEVPTSEDTQTLDQYTQKLVEGTQKLTESTQQKAAAGAQKPAEDTQRPSEGTQGQAEEDTEKPAEDTPVSTEGATANIPVEETDGSASNVPTKKATSSTQQQQPSRSGRSKRSATRMLKEGTNSARAAELRAVQREMEEKFSTGRVPPGVGGKRGNYKKAPVGKRAPRPSEKGHGPQGYGQHGGRGGERKEEAAQRRSSDRDSANHSPADIMMASPSLSNISDNGSSDSGKGGSDVATPPNSHTNAYLGSEQVVVHEFDVPSDIVGRLIGKKGSFVSQIKIKTNAEIVVKPYPPPFSDQKVCIMEGTPSEIEAALKMIRRKFPLESYPKLTLQPWHSSPVQILPEHLYLKLVEGINNDTMICCVESPVNLFVQFPTHPSFMNLTVLQNFMNACYSTESPELPKPVPVGAICAARSKDSWFRAQILSNEDEDHSYIKFLDWGGYELVNNNDLRKIRCDFTYLPFQATECILANILPVADADEEKQDEAIEYIKEISRRGLVFTQVVDYTPEGIPLVVCYVNVGPNHVINLNQVVVDRGYGQWIQEAEELPQEVVEDEAAATVTAEATVMEPDASELEQQA